MRDRHKMHLVNGHRRAASNGHRRAAPDAFTATICRDVQGHYYVTPDPGKVTCKNCARLVLAVARYWVVYLIAADNSIGPKIR